MSDRPVAAPTEIRTAVVLTHTHPEQTSAAVREVVSAAEAAGCALYAAEDEMAKHGESAAGLKPLTRCPACLTSASSSAATAPS